MANATAKSVVVKEMVETEVTKVTGIVLELDNDEARVLSDILARIGGTGRRHIATRIFTALGKAGVEPGLSRNGHGLDIDTKEHIGMYFK